MKPLHTARGAEVPKFAAGMRYLKEELSAVGATVLPPDECLKDFVLDAIEAASRMPQQGESYIASVRRHLKAKAQFILRWMSSDEAFEDEARRGLIGIARKHGLARGPRSASSSAES